MTKLITITVISMILAYCSVEVITALDNLTHIQTNTVGVSLIIFSLSFITIDSFA